ncbi:MAG: hypothetical protein P4M15_04655 [Alphaproteobacteria bacterium]|nr:hypothetical protein [Alphaproteobacteria bacterium]
MDKKIAQLLAAVGAVATMGSMNRAVAQPNPVEILQAKSFAELLEPISDAPAILAAADAQPASAKGEQVAQYYHHHHHHHHHAYHRRYYMPYPMMRRHHHHHHHHHHHNYY